MYEKSECCLVHCSLSLNRSNTAGTSPANIPCNTDGGSPCLSATETGPPPLLGVPSGGGSPAEASSGAVPCVRSVGRDTPEQPAEQPATHVNGTHSPLINCPHLINSPLTKDMLKVNKY